MRQPEEDQLLDTASQQTRTPRVWLILGEKRGDNAQIKNLAGAVGWPVEEKYLFARPQWYDKKPPVRPSLDHIDLDRSDPLGPPWPDLVMTAGRVLSSAAFWVKQASRGQAKMVLVGRPRRLLEEVDLVVVGAHYTLPSADNVVRHDLPFMQVDSKALAEAKELWAPRLSEMKRPLVALLVGGRTGGLRFDADVVQDLMDRTLAFVEAMGGSLFITTSRRTPDAVVETIRERCPRDARLYVFDPDAGPGENPYHGLLGSADHVIATTDSISMMVEAVRLGIGLSLYPLTAEVGKVERVLGRIGILRPLSPRDEPLPAGGSWARTMYRIGILRHSRDLSAIPRKLVELKLASWLGDPPVNPPGPFVDDALDTVAARIRALVDESPASL